MEARLSGTETGCQCQGVVSQVSLLMKAIERSKSLHLFYLQGCMSK